LPKQAISPVQYPLIGVEQLRAMPLQSSARNHHAEFQQAARLFAHSREGVSRSATAKE